MTSGRPTILLTGGRGQLGRELAFVLGGVGHVVACDRTTLDLGHADRIVDVVRESAPHVIVNAAAYTAVDLAEDERDRAFAINAHAPRILAEEAKRANAILVHYSTDYVFDGAARTPYDESAATHPLNVYGESKLAGEAAIAASGAAALVLRTSWVYGRRGQNFLVTMQKLAASRSEINVVDDQIGVPNWTRWLARTTATILDQGVAQLAERAGLYHLCALGCTSWFDFACEILRDRANVRVSPIKTSQYPTPARRPAYGVLDATHFARTFGIVLPDWQTLLHECLQSEAEPPDGPSVH